jgi:anti-sigma regulatory factor (Ser/Thr protein kinase)
MGKSLISTVFISLVAVLIIAGTFFYSDYLSNRIAQKESRQMQEWVTAQQMIAKADSTDDLSLQMVIIAEQKSIPVIEADERDSIMNYMNLDSQLAVKNPVYLKDQLTRFKNDNHLIITYLDADGLKYNKYYYGESTLLKQIRYFPILQLIVVILFISILFVAIQYRHKTEKELLWTGLAKETAHQLGTPISALIGWTAMLRETDQKEMVLNEMDKDINRLELITERFSLIGSKPRKTPTDIGILVGRTIDYIRKRAATKIDLQLGKQPEQPVVIDLAAPLIEWVIENLLKNALDAMEEGTGQIRVDLFTHTNQLIIDITDNGKGISMADQEHIFRPGFSTKKRGWGLGLTLSKRIIEENHGGQLIIKSSEPGKGTTFRIVLIK